MKDRLPALLEQVRGKSFGISFTFDSSTRYWYTDSKPESYDMPTVMELKKVEAFKSTLSLSPEKIRELERKTRDQEEQDDSLQISFMKSLTD